MASEALADVALEFLPQPVFIISPVQMKFVFVNLAACELTGYDREELMLMSVYDLSSLPSADALAFIYDSVYSGSVNVNTFEGHYKRKDLTTFEAESCICSIAVGGAAYIMCTIKNIRTHIDEKLIESEKQLHILVNSIKDHAIYLIDKDAKVMTWNEGARLLKGYTEEEIIGKPMSVFHVSEDIDDEGIDIILNQARQKGSIEIEGRRIRKDGSVFWANVRITAIYDSNGEVRAFSKITRDITEEKLFKDRINEFNKELRESVKQKTVQLTEIFERITDAFMATDANWNVTYINAKAAEILHVDQSASIGAPLLKICPELQTSIIFDRYREAFNEQKYVSCEEYFAPFDRWYLNYIYPSPDGISIFFRDITDKKSVLAELEKTELQYRTLVEHASDAIMINDHQGNYLEVNTSACALTGYTKTEMLSLNIRDIIFHDQAFSHSENSNEQVQQGDASIREIKLKRKDNTVLDVESRTTKLPDGRFLNILRDITERKKVESKLRDSEVNLREAQRLARLGDWHWDYVKNKLHWSEEVYRIFGIPMDKPADYNLFLTYVHPDDRQGVNDAFTNSVQTHSTFDYMYRIDAGGQLKFVHSRGESFYNEFNEPVRSIGTVQDITERKRAEDSLKESESRFKRIFESNMVGFFFYNDKGEVTESNDRTLEIIGYSRYDLEAGNINWEQMTPPEYAHLDKLGLEQIRATGVCQPFDKEYFRKDGSRVPITIGAASIEGNNNQYGVAYILDNSERNRAKNDMAQSRAELRQLAEHLQTIREEERADMAREIHDELGQQLTGLKLDLFWLNKHGNISDEERQQKIQATLVLVDQIIDLVRKISSQLRPSVLDDLGLIDAFQWYSSEFQKRFGISVKFSTGLSALTLDPKASIALFRIYQESLTNVARHAQARHVVATLGVKNNMLRLVISDDGKGLDVEDRKPGKKSLGLLGMRERTLMMGGDFQIHSEAGRGTEVSIVVPFL